MNDHQILYLDIAEWAREKASNDEHAEEGRFRDGEGGRIRSGGGWLSRAKQSFKIVKDSRMLICDSQLSS